MAGKIAQSHRYKGANQIINGWGTYVQTLLRLRAEGKGGKAS